MMRHHGSPPSLRWRRRLLVLGALLLAALTGYVLVLARDQKSQADQHASSSARRTSTPATVPATASAPAPVPCVPSVLGVAATTGATRYGLDQRPDLQIEVTNTGDTPCRANLSDGQIELVVYNGWSRVWGSHDCNVRPGDSMITLAPRQTARRIIQWSGMSSQPHCAGTRQRVGEGNYTLHARFAGIDGRTATFAIAQ